MPCADFSVNTATVYYIDSIVINNISSNADAYLWDFGDGQTSSEINPVHQYIIPGDYYITLTAYSKGGYKKDKKAKLVRIKDFNRNVLNDSRDGKRYNIILYNNKWWMAENLNYSTTSGSWALFDQESYADVYGRLYNWETACDVCPDGWRLPDVDDWTALSNLFDGNSVSGGKLKESDTIHWKSPNTGATNISGFSALPGGYYSGGFASPGCFGRFWTSSKPYPNSINNGISVFLYYNSELLTFGSIYGSYGFSVRCIKDTV
jgi:uncharacterized protein (TIGR02145 family)